MLREQLQNQNSNKAHAYLVFGEQESLQQEIKDHLSDDLGIDLVHNPDIFFIITPQLGINQVRAIQETVSRSNISDHEKYIIISTDAMTVESQNALLKTIEDPASETVFFVLVPPGAFILETVRSRMQTITTATDSYSELAQTYVAAGYSERTKIVESFFHTDEDKKTKANKGELVLFTNELEKLLAKEITNIPEGPAVFHDVIDIKKYLLDRSANVKHIMEYITMRIPKI